MLTFDPQHLPAGRKDAHPRRRMENLLDQTRNRLDQVLAIVEDQQHAPIPQKCEERLHRTAGRDGYSENRRQSAGHESWLGNPAEMNASLERYVSELAGEIVVYPGHGPRTTLERERRTNPFLTGAVRPLRR